MSRNVSFLIIIVYLSVRCLENGGWPENVNMFCVVLLKVSFFSTLVFGSCSIERFNFNKNNKKQQQQWTGLQLPLFHVGLVEDAPGLRALSG